MMILKLSSVVFALVKKLYEELLNNAEIQCPPTMKILIAKTRTFEYETLSNQIDNLIEPARKQESVTQIVRAINH